MLHHFFAAWMEFVHANGYPGVFLLMAIESTVFPLPSEIVVPPAAYYAAQGQLSFWGVVLAATLGSWFGASVSYLFARALGRPFLVRYGRWFFLPEHKWLLAEAWIQKYSNGGVLFARLLPVVRHVVSLPAGAARMPFPAFSISTLVGAFAWSTVLAWFGAQVLGSDPHLLQDPEALLHVVKARLMWFLVAALVMLVAWIAVEAFGKRSHRTAA